MNECTIFTDGGARGNPGPAGVGVVITLGEEMFTLKKYIGHATNNVAEYTGVIEALQLIQEKIPHFSGVIHFFLDSELVVKQLSGIYKVKDQNLKILHAQILETCKSLESTIDFSHVARAKNAQADALVNQVLDEQENLD